MVLRLALALIEVRDDVLDALKRLLQTLVVGVLLGGVLEEFL